MDFGYIKYSIKLSKKGRPKMSEISIIVPVYNPPEQFLRECLDSLVNQTFKDIEIILIDNAATGNCPDILKEYASKDERIILYSFAENQGYPGACNKGIELSHGKYLQIVDSDDYLSLNACQKLYAKAEETEADMLFLSAVSLNAKTGELLPYKAYSWEALPERIHNRVFTFEDIVEEVFFAPSQAWNKFYRRSFIVDNHNFFDIELKRALPDAYFSFNNYINAKRMYLLEDICYYYRENVGGGVVSGLAGLNCNYFHEIIIFLNKIVDLANNKLKRQYRVYIKLVILKVSELFFYTLHYKNRGKFYNLLKSFFMDTKTQALLNYPDAPNTNEYSFYYDVIKHSYLGLIIKRKLWIVTETKIKILGICLFKKKKYNDYTTRKFFYALKVNKYKNYIKYYIFGLCVFTKAITDCQ